MPEIKDRGYDLAVSHWTWLLKWQEQAYLDAFQHGYKHGLEDKDERAKDSSTEQTNTDTNFIENPKILS